MTFEQLRAIFEAYTTLRAISSVHRDKNLALMCAETESLLVNAFPELRILEGEIDSSLESK